VKAQPSPRTQSIDEQASENTTCMVYNQGYTGKTYSVKYLGIVDGTMGILSRKMALVGPTEAAVPITPSAPNDLSSYAAPMSPTQRITSEDHYIEMTVNKDGADR